ATGQCVGLSVFERRRGNRHAAFNPLQTVHDDTVPGLETRFDHPHISGLWAELDGFYRNFVIGSHHSDLINALQLGHRLLGDQKRAFAQFRDCSNTRILPRAQKVARIRKFAADLNCACPRVHLAVHKHRASATRKDGSVFPRRGRTMFVNREVDSRTGTIQVRCEFPNPGNLLRPGQYARIRAVTELRKGALLIPQQSVSELQGVYQVGVVAPDNKVTIKTIKLGPQTGDMWVVESGLQAGDSVVVDGLQRIKSGMTVAPSPFKDTQTNALTGGK